MEPLKPPLTVSGEITHFILTFAKSALGAGLIVSIVLMIYIPFATCEGVFKLAYIAKTVNLGFITGDGLARAIVSFKGDSCAPTIQSSAIRSCVVDAPPAHHEEIWKISVIVDPHGQEMTDVKLFLSPNTVNGPPDPDHQNVYQNVFVTEGISGILEVKITKPLNSNKDWTMSIGIPSPISERKEYSFSS